MRPLRFIVSGTRRRWLGSTRSAFAPVVTGILLLVPVAVVGMGTETALADDATYQAEIRRTAHGIPHVLAADYGDLGFGSGYAAAEDNLCVIADQFLTLSGERSRFFGADGTYLVFNQPITNVDSDFFYRSLAQGSVVEDLLRSSPRDSPPGPSADARALVDGYAAGYNEALRVRKAGEPSAPQCVDDPWVRPIGAIDVWRRMYRFATMTASNGLLQAIATAQPPAAPPDQQPLTTDDLVGRARSLMPGPDTLSPGSNAYGLGGAATVNGRGLLLANPHFPWDGAERFYEAQLTIPGEINVLGASLLGTPMIGVGTTDRVAWTHTVSTAKRFTPFELQLRDGDPTQYLLDGTVHRMHTEPVTITVRGDDGQLTTRTRTLYRTPAGPLVVIPGLFEWSTDKAYAIRDANADNLRLVDTWLAMSKAASVRDLVTSIRRHQGLAFFNTIAADADGAALYADQMVCLVRKRADAVRHSRTASPELSSSVSLASSLVLSDPLCLPQKRTKAPYLASSSPVQLELSSVSLSGHCIRSCAAQRVNRSTRTGFHANHLTRRCSEPLAAPRSRFR